MEFKAMSEDAKTKKGGTNEDTRPEDEERVSVPVLSITMDKRIDLVLAIGIVLVGVTMLMTSQVIRRGAIPDPIGTRGLPNITGVFLVICGIALAVLQLLHWSDLPGHLVPEEGQEDEKGYPASWVRAISIILLSWVWGVLLNPLGFLIITPLCLVVGSLLMGEREWGKIIAFSIIFSFSNWVIFGPLLGIRFPLGPLNHWAVSLGLSM
jgi:hypothetical protein